MRPESWDAHSDNGILPSTLELGMLSVHMPSAILSRVLLTTCTFPGEKRLGTEMTR